MIPYIEIHTYALGPLTLQVWGTFVALGFLLGDWASARMAKARGLDGGVIYDLAPWLILGAFVVARLFHVVLYEPAYYAAHPTEIIAVWRGGMSVIGGMIGAVVATVLYIRHRHLDLLKYADAGVFGLPLGIAIGRIGCFLIHDHPGTLTHSMLGVRYPDGAVRHDLGLYDSINGAILFILFLVLAKRRATTGTFAAIFLAWYGLFRFFTDFLRATSGAIVDSRYLGLTPSQYAAILMVIAAPLVWRRYRR